MGMTAPGVFSSLHGDGTELATVLVVLWEAGVGWGCDGDDGGADDVVGVRW